MFLKKLIQKKRYTQRISLIGIPIGIFIFVALLSANTHVQASIEDTINFICADNKDAIWCRKDSLALCPNKRGARDCGSKYICGKKGALWDCKAESEEPTKPSGAIKFDCSRCDWIVGATLPPCNTSSGGSGTDYATKVGENNCSSTADANSTSRGTHSVTYSKTNSSCDGPETIEVTEDCPECNDPNDYDITANPASCPADASGNVSITKTRKSTRNVCGPYKKTDSITCSSSCSVSVSEGNQSNYTGHTCGNWKVNNTDNTECPTNSSNNNAKPVRSCTAKSGSYCSTFDQRKPCSDCTTPTALNYTSQTSYTCTVGSCGTDNKKTVTCARIKARCSGDDQVTFKINCSACTRPSQNSSSSAADSNDYNCEFTNNCSSSAGSSNRSITCNKIQGRDCGGDSTYTTSTSCAVCALPDYESCSCNASGTETCQSRKSSSSHCSPDQLPKSFNAPNDCAACAYQSSNESLSKPYGDCSLVYGYDPRLAPRSDPPKNKSQLKCYRTTVGICIANQNELTEGLRYYIPVDRTCNSSSCECSVDQLFDQPSAWSACDASNQKTRTRTLKSGLSPGNPDCVFPGSIKDDSNFNGTTTWTEKENCRPAAPGEDLPEAALGSLLTFLNITGSNAWTPSSFLFHKVENNKVAKIGIGTTSPNEVLEISDASNTNATTRLRVTDLNHNPEMQLQYGIDNEPETPIVKRWSLYVKNIKATGETTEPDKSLRIWGFGQDRVIIDQEGRLHAAKFCTNVGTSGCTELTGGGEQLWTKDANTKVISYSAAAVKIGNAAGLTLGEDRALGTANTAGALKFISAGDNTRSTSFVAGTQTADIAYTLPSAVGISGQFLKLGSNNALSWSDTGAPDLAQYQVNNLVVNGGFENPYGGAAEGKSDAIVNTQAHSGQLSLKKEGTTTFFIPVRKNTKYSASLWIKGDNLSSYEFEYGTLILSRCTGTQSGDCNATVGETDKKFPVAASYDWTYVSHQNFDSKNSTYIRFDILGPKGNFYIDDIALYEAPSSFAYSDRFLTMSGNQGIYGKLGINYMPTHQSDPVFVVLSRNHISSGSVTLTVSAGSVNATLNNYSGGLLVQPGDFIYIPSLGAKKGVGIRSGPDILSDRSWQVTLSDPFPSAVTSQSFMIIQQLAGFSGLDSSKNGAGGEVVITGDGRVGIGGEPQTKLHVSGGYSWGTAISLDATGVKKENPNSVDSYIDNTVGSRWDLISTGGDPAEGIKKFLIKDVGANKVRLTIDKDGNVGINTTAPTRFLEIIGVGGSVGIGVNTTTTNKNVLLEMDSLSQGFLPPRMTSDQMGAIPETKPVGLTIYNTTDKEYKVYDGTVWKAMGLPLGTAQGQTLWWDNADTAKKWVADNKLTIANNGSVSVGTATDDEAEVSRFIVKDKETSGTKGFYVGFEGNNTTLSTTPYPRLGASVKIDFYNPKDSFKKGLEVVEGNKIKLTYFISNTGTRKLKVKSVTDTHCPNSMTQVYKNGSNTINVGDTDENDILNALPLGTVTAVPANSTTPATEWWVYTCTTGAVPDAGISMATSTVTVAPITASGSEGTQITDTTKWKATFDPMGAVPAYQQPQSMQERAVASAPAERAVSSLVAPKPVTNASAAIVITKFGAPSVVTIAWSNSSNATSYDVYRRTRSGSEGGWSSTKLNSHQSPVMDNVSIPKDTKDLEYQIVAINRYGDTSIIVEVNVVRDSKSATNIEPHNNSSSPKTEPTPPETPLQTYTTTPVAPKTPLPKPESVPTPSTTPLPSQNPSGSGASSGGRAAPVGPMP